MQLHPNPWPRRASLALGPPAEPCLLGTLYLSMCSSLTSSRGNRAGRFLLSLDICSSPAPGLYLGISINGNVCYVVTVVV